MTTVTATLTIQVDGSDAAAAAAHLAEIMAAGQLDRGITDAIRAEMADRTDARDWRIAGARLWPATEEQTP